MRWLIWPTGGVYVEGGIAPKILRWLQLPDFIEAFRNKGQNAERNGEDAGSGDPIRPDSTLWACSVPS